MTVARLIVLWRLIHVVMMVIDGFFVDLSLCKTGKLQCSYVILVHVARTLLNTV